MLSGNNLSLIGNLTQDADLVRSKNTNKVMVVFSICWNKTVYNSETKVRQQEPNFFNCKSKYITEAQANVVLGQLKKGTRIGIIDSHIEVSSWTDKNGCHRENMNVIIDDIVTGLVIIPKQTQEKTNTPVVSEQIQMES